MAETISVLRTLAGENLEYHQLLCRLNKQLHGRMGGRFVTALFFVIDTQAKKVYAVSAGHGPLLISRSAGQEIIDLPLQGQVPLGLLADVPYETVCADLKAGDRIIAFSDGLPEARNNKGEEFGDQKVLALARGQGGSAADLLTKLQGAVEGFSTKQAHDDITIVVAGLKGG
jgi:serine phosphatase RsbU (regulator of sigma subunit)